MIGGTAHLRLEVPDRDTLQGLTEAPLPAGLRCVATAHERFRDTYFDTAERTLAALGVTTRVRWRLDDRRFLEVRVPEGPNVLTFQAEVHVAAAADALRGTSSPARRLAALVDPDRLKPTADLTVQRCTRRARRGLLPLDRFTFWYDAVTARRGELEAELYELTIRQLRPARCSLDDVATALRDEYRVRTTWADTIERAEAALQALEGRALAAGIRQRREVTVLAVEGGRVALQRTGADLRLPFLPGTGEASCRDLLRQTLGHAEGQFALLGTVPATETRPAVEVWLARRLRRDAAARGSYEWFAPSELTSRVGSPVLRDPRTLAALAVASRSDLLPEWVTSDGETAAHDADTERAAASRRTLAALRLPALPERSLDTQRPVPDQFFNAELSWLEFNARVLALAEDPGVPLLARLRFVSIFGTNLDEFYRVRVAALKLDVHEGHEAPSPDGLHPREALEAVAVRIRALVRRQYRIAHRLLGDELPAHGVSVRRWGELDEAPRARLAAWFDDHVYPMLTPKAITMAPGHPFPLIEDLVLSLAVTLRDPRSGAQHFSQLKVPDALPRFAPADDAGTVLVPLEDVIRAHAARLFPGRSVTGVYPFRLTRVGDLDLDERAAASFLQAIEEEVQQRPRAPVVRIELGHDVPDTVRGLLQRELRFEEAEHADLLAEADVYAVDGLVNLGALMELTAAGPPALDYPAFTGADPFAADASVFERVDAGDVLVHHPYDRFDATFERFVAEAAEDPDVVAIKLTLYRPGGPSRIGAALTQAAAAGKDVSVFVELKARFDEERNVRWVRQLEGAGIHVVTGLVRLKTHAKIALVVRRVRGAVRRYAHIASGNYNPVSARLYTDFGLFTADPAITADLAALFNELTGSSAEPRAAFERLLVAPTTLAAAIVQKIRRESAHARAGRPGRIRAKVNAVSDVEIIAALYEASQAGVTVDLVVRGICTLRPGVPGLSERIRVVSAVGRFLEHGRIYHFGNAGDDEYYISSADWRPRNLRRRVEVAVPVSDPAARGRLALVLDREVDDPQAFELQSDGSYVKVTPPTGLEPLSAQDQFLSVRAAPPTP